MAKGAAVNCTASSQGKHARVFFGDWVDRYRAFGEEKVGYCMHELFKLIPSFERMEGVASHSRKCPTKVKKKYKKKKITL